jgi:hypothetical protein
MRRSERRDDGAIPSGPAKVMTVKADGTIPPGMALLITPEGVREFSWLLSTNHTWEEACRIVVQKKMVSVITNIGENPQPEIVGRRQPKEKKEL